MKSTAPVPPVRPPDSASWCALLRRPGVDPVNLARPRDGGGWLVNCRLLPQRQITRRLALRNGLRELDGQADSPRQALVSNVDTALLVMGLDADFNLRRLER